MWEPEPRLGPGDDRIRELEEIEQKRWRELVRGLAQNLKGNTMHYRNGREVKNGDKVVKFSITGGKIEAVGILHDAVPGNDHCNGSIAPTQTAVTGACMCDCLHADDLAELLKEKGLDVRPAGK